MIELILTKLLSFYFLILPILENMDSDLDYETDGYDSSYSIVLSMMRRVTQSLSVGTEVGPRVGGGALGLVAGGGTLGRGVGAVHE